MSKKGIYLEVRRISGISGWHGGLHAYLVYRDGKGGERVISGGPKSFLDSLFGGDIDVEVDIPLDQSRDKYGDGERPGSRLSKELDLGGRPAEEVWATMAREGRRIHEGEIDYDYIPLQNSNSVARAVLEAGGIDAYAALPEGLEQYAWPGSDVTRKAMMGAAGIGYLPGFDNDLSKPYDAIDRLWRRGAPGAKARPSATGTSASRSLLIVPIEGADGADAVRQAVSPRAGRPMAPHEAAMAKPVSAWSDDDARAVMAARIGRSMTEAERQAMAERERAFFRHRHGDGPARHDATGRLMPVGLFTPYRPEPRG